MNCFKCGNPIKDGQKFCTVCGTPCGIPVKKNCAKCGAELMEGARFCLNCGDPVAPVAEPVQKVQPVVPVQNIQPAVPVQEEYSVLEQPVQYSVEKPKAAHTKRNVIILVIVLVLLLVGAFIAMFVVSARTSQTLVETLALAERYLDEQDYEQAVIEFKNLLEIDPKNTDAYLGLAEAYEGIGEYDKAAKVLREAKEIVDESDADDISDALTDLEELIAQQTAGAEEVETSGTTAATTTPVADTTVIIDNETIEIIDTIETAEATDGIDPMDIIGMKYEEAVEKYFGILVFEPVYVSNSDEEISTIFYIEYEGSGNIAVGSTVRVKVSTGSLPEGAYTTIDMDEFIYDDPEVIEPAPGEFTPSGNAGVITFLGYYDITVDAKGMEQRKIFESELYGGSIEWINSSYGSAYYDMLATMIAAGDSPDFVTYEPLAYPYGVSRNLFEPLDDHINMDSTLWVDMKPYIEAYSYNDKHCYYPHRVSGMYALNYNRRTVQNAGLPDPYELYRNGEWTWTAWESMMADFCAVSDDHIGYYATDTVLPSFVNTTGGAVIALNGGILTNNCSSALTNTAMDFLAHLGKSGFAYPAAAPYGDWVSPQIWAGASDKILFLMMEPEWTYIAATEEIQNDSGVENDIHDVVSDFAFVPLPRYDNADVYYNTISTFGYMVPKGASNIDGVVEWFNLNRMYETDSNIQAQLRQDAIAPEVTTYTAGKYEGMQKWRITWDADMYDLLMEMRTPDTFVPVNDVTFGFGDDMTELVCDGMFEVAAGNGSWQEYCRANSIGNAVDSTLSAYR